MHSLTKFPSSMGQRIILAGLGLQKFDEALAAISNINDMFEGEVPEGQFQPLETAAFEGFTCLRFANRYLTLGGDNHQTEPYKIVDPFGILRRAVGHKYNHTEENMVQYFRQREFERENGERFICLSMMSHSLPAHQSDH